MKVLAAGKDACMALAVVLLHHQSILILEDGRKNEPIILDVLTYVILLKQAVVT